MRFVDLEAEYAFYEKDINNNIQRVLSSGRYLLGSELERLEKNFSCVSGMKNSVGVKNCTDAIMLLLSYLYTPEMPIILPNFGAYPTAVACRNFTDKIYYVDVDRSMTIDVSKLPDVRNGIIIPVHLFGNNCNMDKIMNYARENNHIVIEDCAQSAGSLSGATGDYSVFSFYPTKPIGAMGDGGMICSNLDLDVFKKLRFYGQQDSQIEMVGVNSRMDEIQSSIVNTKLNKYKILNNKRRQIASRYLNIVDGINWDSNAVFHQFVVLFNKRDVVLDKLSKNCIPYMIHYKHHVSEMPPLEGKDNQVRYRVNDKCVSLPCFPFMEESEIAQVEDFLFKYKDYEFRE